MGRWRPAVAGLLLALGLGASSAQAQEADPWFGRDKALHFGVSAGLAAGGWGLGAVLGLEETWQRALLGGALALGAGLAKEGADALGYGHPSGRDLVWDVLGTGAGLGVAWQVQWVWR